MTEPKRRSRQLLRLLLVLLAIAPLGYTIYREWPEFRTAFGNVEWTGYVVAQLLLALGMLLIITVPWSTLRSLGSTLSMRVVGQVYFATQLLKYLPGGVWAFPGRIVVYQYLGVGSAQSFISVFREITALFMGAAVVGLLGIFQGLPISSSLRLALGIGIGVSVITILLTHFPWFWRILSSIRLPGTSQLAQYDTLDRQHQRIQWLPRTLLLSIALWLLVGVPFRQLAMAVVPGLEGLSWLGAAGIFALAWCAGFVVIFVPAGIGVREGALSLLVAHLMPVGAALTLALLSRMMWVLAEGLWILVALFWASERGEISWDVLRGMGEGEPVESEGV
jgi:hypothetical protein